MGRSQAVRHQVLVLACGGSNPSAPAKENSMTYSAPLYLASRSVMRRELLTHAQIPFSVIDNAFDESLSDWTADPLKVASSIARQKMENLSSLPAIQSCYVITADTICIDSQGTIFGKPKNRTDAVSMLTSLRNGATTLTGFCIDKKSFIDNSWFTDERLEQIVTTKVVFDVPDIWLNEYIAKSLAMDCAGALMIESATQFVKTINGSYTNIMGLPLCEVRQALTIMGFFVFDTL